MEPYFHSSILESSKPWLSKDWFRPVFMDRSGGYPRFWHVTGHCFSTCSCRLLFRRFAVFGIMVWLMLTTGCSTADLTSEERLGGLKQIDSDLTADHLRPGILETIDPFNLYQEGSSMDVVATDAWNSTIIRWLTPLDQNEQHFRANLKLFHKGIEFTFLDGDQKGKTIGFDGESYHYEGGRKIYEKSAAVSLYLGPLQNYMEWHRTLMNKKKLTLLGEKDVNSRSYWVVYATEGNASELDQHDQFLIYINKNSNTIDYIEFTMRKLMKSYVGVVHYQQYRRVKGMLMPFWIGVADDLTSPGFDHVFTITSIRFDP